MPATPPPPAVLQQHLRRALSDAMRDRDRTAVSALRTTLAAVQNAEAQPAPPPPDPADGALPGALVGLGAGEVPRRVLGEADVAAIVTAEVAEREDAARRYDELGRGAEARRLRAEASAIRARLGPAMPTTGA